MLPHTGASRSLARRAGRLVSAHVSREGETGPFVLCLADICRVDAPGAGFGSPGGAARQQWKAGFEPSLAFPEHLPQLWTQPGLLPQLPALGARIGCQAWARRRRLLPPLLWGAGPPQTGWGPFKAAVKGAEAGWASGTQTAAWEKSRPISKNSPSTVRGSISLSSQICLSVGSRVVRLEGGTLLSWNQRLREPPSHRPPQGPDCPAALNAPACHGARGTGSSP